MITLISPPDIYENENDSLLLINITEQEQEDTSTWFANNEYQGPLNIYFYTGENDIPWLLHAVAVSRCVYINCDNSTEVTKWLTSYLLSKKHIWYKLEDSELAHIMNFINHKRTNKITDFLEVNFGKQR